MQRIIVTGAFLALVAVVGGEAAFAYLSRLALTQPQSARSQIATASPVHLQPTAGARRPG